MSDFLTKAMADIAQRGGPGAILHLGAGQAQEVAAFLKSPAKAILLVEPQPALAADLQARAAAEPRITLRQAAVAGKAGTAMMQLFNLAEMSSLRGPALLRELYPGLRQTGTVKVPVVTFGDLMKALPAARPGVPDLLVIDVCGEEGTVIAALAALADRQRFGAVLVQAGLTPLFEGAAEAAGLVAQMEAAGFRLSGQDTTDPDQPLLWFAPDRATGAVSSGQGQEVTTLRADLEAARDAALAERDGMRNILAESRAAHEARHDAQAEQLAASRAEAAALAAQVTGQQAELEAMYGRLILAGRGAPPLAVTGIGSLTDTDATETAPGVVVIDPDNLADTEVGPLQQKLSQTEAARAALAGALGQSREDHALAVARAGMARADAAEMQQRLTAALALCHQQAAVVRDLTAALRSAESPPPREGKPSARPRALPNVPEA